MTSDTTSPFLKLPAELRNEIYSLAFADKTIVFSTTKNSRYRTSHTTSTHDEVTGFPGILGANKQTRSETRLLIYSTAKFAAISTDPLIRWLKSLDAETRMTVKRVCMWSSSPSSLTLMSTPSGLPQIAHKRAQGMKYMLRTMGIAVDGATVEYEIWSKDGESKIWPVDGQVEDA